MYFPIQVAQILGIKSKKKLDTFTKWLEGKYGVFPAFPEFLAQEIVRDHTIAIQKGKRLRRSYRGALYSDFLLSENWSTARSVVFTRDGHKCFLCPNTDQLECHHRRYYSWADPIYLLTLCRECHAGVHARPFWEQGDFLFDPR